MNKNILYMFINYLIRDALSHSLITKQAQSFDLKNISFF